MKLLAYHIKQDTGFLESKHKIHDSNISYFDGKDLYYLKTERLIQDKHHMIYLRWCDSITKAKWGITRDTVDDYIFTSFNGNTVRNNGNYINFIPEIYSESLENGYKYIDHHYAHSLSVSLLEDVDVSINIDGLGSSKSWSVYRRDTFVDCGYKKNCGSIGIGFASLAPYFNIKGHEQDLAGKLMGLQSYGRIDPLFLKKLRNYDYNSLDSIFLYSNFVEHIGDPIKASSYEIKLNWLRTIHERCGEIILELFKRYVNTNENIGYSGGVAQNVIWNTKLKNNYPNLIIMPHCGDEGLSLGGIEYLRKKYKLPRLNINNFPFAQFDESPKDFCIQIDRVAKALSEGKIVAWYQGNGEIGPRALGNRSILMDPRILNGKDRINKIKNREFFRPFGASVLSEFSKEYFDMDFENPYMLYVGKVKKNNLYSITHIDGTCRVQTVKDGIFKQLLDSFYNITGCPVLLNTSLNNSGKPIAGYIENALQEFKLKDIDMLIIGNQIYEKGT